MKDSVTKAQKYQESTSCLITHSLLTIIIIIIIIIIIKKNDTQALTKWGNKWTGYTEADDDGKNTQHPGILDPVLEVP